MKCMMGRSCSMKHKGPTTNSSAHAHSYTGVTCHLQFKFRRVSSLCGNSSSNGRSQFRNKQRAEVPFAQDGVANHCAAFNSVCTMPSIGFMGWSHASVASSQSGVYEQGGFALPSLVGHSLVVLLNWKQKSAFRCG
eukprot:5653771-Amphidinium_carterae.1